MTFTKDQKTIALLAAVCVGAYMLYKHSKKPVVRKAMIVEGDSGNIGEMADVPRLVVGTYDQKKDTTWIFPEGHPEQGRPVKGKVNAPQGTYFEGSNVF